MQIKCVLAYQLFVKLHKIKLGQAWDFAPSSEATSRLVNRY